MSDRSTAAALAAAVRDRLMGGEEAAVPGLGTFRVRHEVSRVEVREDGSRVLRPPRDTVRFEAEHPERLLA